MLIKNTLLASALALCTFSAPIPASDSDCPTGLTAQELNQISQQATASCDGATYADECADSTRAATAINQAFETYKITSVGEQAALVAYMLFESGNFKYNKNHFPAPGRPGQGTRMMAMPPVIEMYATSVAGAAAVAQAKAKGDADGGLASILALVNSDDANSFGAAAWFLTSQCSSAVRAGLDAETVDGWHAFLTECVDTTLDPARDEPWTAAKQIMLG
jgi:hypothetical protein